MNIMFELFFSYFIHFKLLRTVCTIIFTSALHGSVISVVLCFRPHINVMQYLSHYVLTLVDDYCNFNTWTLTHG